MTEDNGSRIGVFVCRCGGQQDLSLDMDKIVSRIEGSSDVVTVKLVDYLCHERSRKEMVDIIKKESLDRVVVAACTPRLYLNEFQDTVQSAGLNRMMIEMANIREQVAWVHFEDREGATRKAGDMISMAVAKVALQQPSDLGNVAFVNKKRCTGCGVCESVCNVNAVHVLPDKDHEGKRRATVNPKACVGCGACVSACPTSALDQTYFSNRQMVAQIEDLLSHKDEKGSFPNIIVFTCNWCSYSSADQAGLMRMPIDTGFRTIRVMCSARVDPEWIIKAMSLGADGVLVLAGKPGRCHYDIGNMRTRKRMTLLKMVFKEYGFDENRFQIKFVDSEQPDIYARTINEYVQTIRELGPNPIEPTTIVDPVRVELPYLKL
ncbi:MAG: hydrogenase iron-sulfur subunit [Methanomassiliicoccales archaeon]|nr:MAG: hydrogenase iron-sulfur subunit [Methanomassiliicoccales archaeon]